MFHQVFPGCSYQIWGGPDVWPASKKSQQHVLTTQGIGTCEWTRTHTYSGWWYTYPSEKYDFVSWDYDILWHSPYMMGKIKFMFQTTNQTRMLWESMESMDVPWIFGSIPFLWIMRLIEINLPTKRVVFSSHTSYCRFRQAAVEHR